MENEQNSAQRKKWTAERVFNRAIRVIVGMAGLLLFAALLAGFGWLFFLCWLWDHRHRPWAIRQTVLSDTKSHSEVVPKS